ncbi:MAG: hypothetical protein JNK15_23875 [Planctomycetes bacterium]|nr:hypothetical protein [Planctomycetota bacterium]
MHKLTLTLLAAATSAAALSAQQPAGTAPEPQPVQWKELTRKGLPIKFYGFFRFDVHYNSARMDSAVIATRVLPETKRNDDQLSFDPRLTRFGVELTPVKTGESTVTGKLEIDFANFPTGPAESRATPRIRLAYLDVAEGQYGLRVGQDWDLISPLMPAVNGEMLMWNAGNLGDRRAQIQGRYGSAPKFDKGEWELKVALGHTGAVNNEDLDSTAGERDGFDSGVPHLQFRLATKPFEPVEKKVAEIGVWGLFGRTETDTAFNGEKRFDTWVGGVDIVVPVAASLTLRSELWTGENLGDVRGGIGQTINTATGEEIASSGGWAELVYAYTQKTRFHLGATLDDPKNDDLSTTLANANRRRNQSAYVGSVVDWDSGVRTGLDLTYWQTEYAGADGTNGNSGNAVRVDLWFQFDF